MTHPQITISAATFSDSFLQNSDGRTSPALKLQLSLPAPPAQDKDYYIPDGNTVLLVQDTLFKVHMSTLKKDRSAFESMFSLAGVNTSIGPEGESDDNPIRLQGDTSDEFRALLWALYALPHELMVAHTPNADVLTLYRLALISHKYQFRSIETWALAAITTFYSRPAPAPLLEDSSRPSLAQITELAALCEQQPLLDLCIAAWKRQLGDRKNISEAIIIAERLDLRVLLGLAYYEMLLKGRDYSDQDPLLARSHRVRLLMGHYELCRLWDRLPNEPPSLTHSARCTGGTQVRCNQAWSMIWRGLLDAAKPTGVLSHPDVLHKLELAESNLKTMVERKMPLGYGQVDDGLTFCKDNAILAVSAKVKDVQDSLADYFVDVR